MEISYLSCQKKAKVLNDDSFILPFEEISQKGRIMRPICHEKMTHLGKSCVTVKDLMDIFYEKSELSDVICEEFNLSSDTSSKTNFEKNH